MKRPRLTALCVLLTFFVSSGFAFSQEVLDAYNMFFQGYYDEFDRTEELSRKRREYSQLTDQLRQESFQATKEIIDKSLEERRNALRKTPTPEEQMQIIREVSDEVLFNSEYALHQKLMEKEKDMFPDAKERQQRQYQLRESITKRLESFDDPRDIYLLTQTGNPAVNSFVQPDFLGLTHEQRDLIKAMQKETFLKISQIRVRSMSEQPEKQNELMQLIQNIGKAQTDEDRNEIGRKMYQMQADTIKNYIPELKAVLIEDRENYMRVLTDAQKAKIKAVMDDMPDYMKNLFAAIDKQGGGLSILNNWVPGMGAPGVNPNREMPRQRSTSNRTLPEN